jgi:hypothetical protein
MVRDQVSSVGVRGTEPIFFAKGPAFPGGVGSCVVSMNNESLPINPRAERKKLCENMNTVVLGIKYVAFWKRVEEVKSNGFRGMATIVFGSWMVCLGLSGGRSSTQNQLCSCSVHGLNHDLSRVIVNCQP